tara:strand:+ start:4700 stop:4930 length:231 start_codon:yes stop_codon:yes gene_type:complete
MVSKIIVYDEEDPVEDETVDTATFQTQMLEYMQAMDWKLWELLKIEQARAAKEDLPVGQPKPAVKFNSIIVDEDDT